MSDIKSTDSAKPPRDTDDDVTVWFRALETGDQAAAFKLWDYCYPRLLRYARAKLPENLRKALDEEDVALSALKSLCAGAQEGSLQTVQNRTELWKLLTCITARKAHGYVKHETRQKRGGGKIRGESIFLSGGERGEDAASSEGLAQERDSSLPPDMLVEIAEDCQAMLDALGDEMLQTIALLRIEGYSVQEIADRLGCAKRSVERRLQLIRKIWTTNDTPED